jgi:hypothetical protein
MMVKFGLSTKNNEPLAILYDKFFNSCRIIRLSTVFYSLGEIIIINGRNHEIFFGPISYEYTKAVGQTRQITPDVTFNLNYNFTNPLSFNGTFESNRTNNQPAINTVNNANQTILTAYHDTAESQSKTNIDKTYIAISNNF